MSKTITIEDLNAYNSALEAEIADLEVTTAALAVENKSLRRSLAGVRAVATRRKGAVADSITEVETIQAENTQLRRSIAGYKAQATRRRNITVTA
jgi:regulator of replication initiation timing